ncbi:hypothetical protein [Bacillus paranthracis]|uniref:hypothetical protein n=2 Tax=Bacillus TaxID=1386 RepID=UPI0001A113BD|nr:hypothetical protein bcere0029_55490 [Bacillus cereus AH1272]EEL90210.1 hypothetical protein bcere0030_58850 [Bacillus cereus AH1273]
MKQEGLLMYFICNTLIEKGDTVRNVKITELTIYVEDGKMVEMFVSYQFLVSRNDIEKEIFILLDQERPKVLEYGDNGFKEIMIKRKILNHFLKLAYEEFKIIRFKALFHNPFPTKPPVLTYFKELINKEKAALLKEEVRKKFLDKVTSTIDVILFVRDFPEIELAEKYIQSKKEDSFTIYLYTPYYCGFRNFKYHVLGKGEFVDRITFYVEYLGQEKGDTHTNIKVLSIQ